VKALLEAGEHLNGAEQLFQSMIEFLRKCSARAAS